MRCVSEKESEQIRLRLLLSVEYGCALKQNKKKPHEFRIANMNGFVCKKRQCPLFIANLEHFCYYLYAFDFEYVMRFRTAIVPVASHRVNHTYRKNRVEIKIKSSL